MTEGGVLLTVIVPTWNRANLIGRCLESLADQTLDAGDYEVVVVNDGSVDETPARCAEFEAAHPNLRFTLVNRANGGINAARNSGIAVARGEAITFLDDDEEAPNTHLQRIVDQLAAHPELEGVGGPYLDPPEAKFRTCGSCSIGAHSLPFVHAQPSHQLLGGNMTIRRAALDEVGPFDEDLSGRADEQEWYHRANRLFLYDPELPIYHRRDELSLREQCTSQFRQGRSLPRSYHKQGKAWRPRPARIGRLIGHGVRRRCDQGFVLAARELGATIEWLNSRVRRKV